MRIESFSEGDVVHVIKRGARGMDIFADDSEKWRFLNSLFILNDHHKSRDWVGDTKRLPMFTRPEHWPKQVPLTRVLAWTLMPNHIHLVLQEVEKGGISKFMQRISGSMTLRFNGRNGNQGSLFQGAYKAKRVNDDDYLRYLLFYVLVKNVLENYPGGLKAALFEFEKAWGWALAYPFSSLRFAFSKTRSPVIDDSENLLSSVVGSSFDKDEIYLMLVEFVTKQ